MVKDISDLKKTNEQNHIVIKNLVEKVELLDKNIITLKSNNLKKGKIENHENIDEEETKGNVVDSSQNCEEYSFSANFQWYANV